MHSRAGTKEKMMLADWTANCGPFPVFSLPISPGTIRFYENI
jgi:hypothetical protein